ncbi:hypothetical protein BDK51DRAFT_44758 [Blyttiomyces helicus]|uniref:Uncharacterized protein n=1 Tax=Blyttiomyces helicus TaxID=388810 RepID=A0A4P9VZY0_9FUNG|nr:hypothetical protein BDK51DRAFT_44758 [Blyttiomyces helicus]|eukprot:RKO85389.1 hypothetical protein BDK51DRAFT_44758 [Blyttiomyces helicus]
MAGPAGSNHIEDDRLQLLRDVVIQVSQGSRETLELCNLLMLKQFSSDQAHPDSNNFTFTPQLLTTAFRCVSTSKGDLRFPAAVAKYPGLRATFHIYVAAQQHLSSTPDTATATTTPTMAPTATATTPLPPTTLPPLPRQIHPIHGEIGPANVRQSSPPKNTLPTPAEIKGTYCICIDPELPSVTRSTPQPPPPSPPPPPTTPKLTSSSTPLKNTNQIASPAAQHHAVPSSSEASSTPHSPSATYPSPEQRRYSPDREGVDFCVINWFTEPQAESRSLADPATVTLTLPVVPVVTVPPGRSVPAPALGAQSSGITTQSGTSRRSSSPSLRRHPSRHSL